MLLNHQIALSECALTTLRINNCGPNVQTVKLTYACIRYIGTLHSHAGETIHLNKQFQLNMQIMILHVQMPVYTTGRCKELAHANSTFLYSAEYLYSHLCVCLFVCASKHKAATMV